MLVPVKQVVRPQGCIHVVHEGYVAGVVQAGAFGQQAGLAQNEFCVFVALFGQKHLVAFFIDCKVACGDHPLSSPGVFFAYLALEGGHHLIDGGVHGGVVFGLPADNQRGSRLINQNGVHFVHNGKVLAALHSVSGFVHHVVPQVIKPKFVVGAVSDVGLVGCLLLFARRIRQINTYRQS